MTENTNQTTSFAQLNAPTYSELFKLVTDLQEKVRSLEDNSTLLSASSTTPVERTKDVVNYRVLSNLDNSTAPFTGREKSHEAEDWISSVDRLARLYEWPLIY